MLIQLTGGQTACRKSSGGAKDAVEGNQRWGFDCGVARRAAERSCEGATSKVLLDNLASGNMTTDPHMSGSPGLRAVSFLMAMQDGLKGIEKYSTQVAAKRGCGSLLVFGCCSTWPGAAWSIAGWIQPPLQVILTTLGGFSTPHVLAALLEALDFTWGTPSPPSFLPPSFRPCFSFAHSFVLTITQGV